jgi:hypothetical protein
MKTGFEPHTQYIRHEKLWRCLIYIKVPFSGLYERGRFNHLTPELNLSTQHYLPRFFTGDFNF